jgi:uncharacterized BrkB/YihY/UPF0761 family membrane protein
MKFLLICGEVMEMVFDYGGARFLGCVTLIFVVFLVVYAWSVDVVRKWDGVLL